MILGFVVYRCHGNIDFSKLSVYAQQVVKILRRSDGGKFTKTSFKNVRYGSQKTVSNHLNLCILLGGERHCEVKCLAEEQNTMTPTRTSRFGVFKPRALTIGRK